MVDELKKGRGVSMIPYSLNTSTWKTAAGRSLSTWRVQYSMGDVSGDGGGLRDSAEPGQEEPSMEGEKPEL